MFASQPFLCGPSLRFGLAAVPAAVRALVRGEIVVGTRSVVDDSVVSGAALASDAAAAAGDVVSTAPAVRSFAPAPLCYEVTRHLDGRFVALEAHMRRLELSIAAALLTPDDPVVAAALSPPDTCVAATLLADVTERVAASHALLVQSVDGTPAAVPDAEGSAVHAFNCNVKTVVWRRDAASGAAPVQAAAAGAPGQPRPSLALLGYCTYFIHSVYPPPSAYSGGVVCGLLHSAGRDPATRHAKTVQAALRARVAASLAATGAFEALLVEGPEGGFLVPEGSRSNYICVAPGTPCSGDGCDATKGWPTLFTSLDDDVLLGVTRGLVEACCARHGVRLVKRRVTATDLFDRSQCAAVALLGTSLGVLPVRGVRLNSADPAVAEGLRPALAKARVERHPAASESSGKDDEDDVFVWNSQHHPLLKQLRVWYLEALSEAADGGVGGSTTLVR